MYFQYHLGNDTHLVRNLTAIVSEFGEVKCHQMLVQCALWGKKMKNLNKYRFVVDQGRTHLKAIKNLICYFK